MKRLFIPLLLFIFVAPLAHGQALTPSEEAARTERPATLAERQRKSRECGPQFEYVQKTPFRIAEGVAGPVVKGSPEQFLIIVSMVQQPPGEQGFAITRSHPLPNGGFASFDFCRAVELLILEPPKKLPSTRRILAFQLRRNLKILKDYPNTFATKKALRQLLTLPEQTYVLLRKAPDFDPAEWAYEHGANVSVRTPDMPAVKYSTKEEEIVLFPILASWREAQLSQ